MPSELDRLHRVHDRAKKLSKLPDFRRAVADAYPLYVQAVADYERAAATAAEKCVEAARAALAKGMVRQTPGDKPLAHLWLYGKPSPASKSKSKSKPRPVTDKQLAADILGALNAGYDARIVHALDPGVWRVHVQLRTPIRLPWGTMVSCVRPTLPALIDPRHARSVRALEWMRERAPDVYRLVALYHIGGLADLHSNDPIVPKPVRPQTLTNEWVTADSLWKDRFPTSGPDRAYGSLDASVMPADAAEKMLSEVKELMRCTTREGGKSNGLAGDDAGLRRKRPLKACEARALRAYKELGDERPELLPDAGKPLSPEAWEWIQTHHYPTHPIDRKTFERYLRAARGPTHPSKARRSRSVLPVPTRSIVRASDLPRR